MFIEMLIALFASAIFGAAVVYIANRSTIKRLKLSNFELVSKIGRERNQLIEMQLAERRRVRQLQEASKKGTAASQAAAARRRKEKAAAAKLVIGSVSMKPVRKSK